jgi:hypothetical protein
VGVRGGFGGFTQQHAIFTIVKAASAAATAW